MMANGATERIAAAEQALVRIEAKLDEIRMQLEPIVSALDLFASMVPK